MIRIINGDAALSIWAWRFLITFERTAMRLHRIPSICLYPDYEHSLREWLRNKRRAVRGH